MNHKEIEENAPQNQSLFHSNPIPHPPPPLDTTLLSSLQQQQQQFQIPFFPNTSSYIPSDLLSHNTSFIQSPIKDQSLFRTALYPLLSSTTLLNHSKRFPHSNSDLKSSKRYQVIGNHGLQFALSLIIHQKFNSLPDHYLNTLIQSLNSPQVLSTAAKSLALPQYAYFLLHSNSNSIDFNVNNNMSIDTYLNSVTLVLNSMGNLKFSDDELTMALYGMIGALAIEQGYGAAMAYAHAAAAEIDDLLLSQTVVAVSTSKAEENVEKDGKEREVVAEKQSNDNKNHNHKGILIGYLVGKRGVSQDSIEFGVVEHGPMHQLSHVCQLKVEGKLLAIAESAKRKDAENLAAKNALEVVKSGRISVGVSEDEIQSQKKMKRTQASSSGGHKGKVNQSATKTHGKKKQKVDKNASDGIQDAEHGNGMEMQQ